MPVHAYFDGYNVQREWLDYSPPTWPNRVRFPEGSLGLLHVVIVPNDVSGFSQGYPVSSRPCIAELLHSHPASPSSALKTPLLSAAENSPLTNPIGARQPHRRPGFQPLSQHAVANHTHRPVPRASRRPIREWPRPHENNHHDILSLYGGQEAQCLQKSALFLFSGYVATLTVTKWVKATDVRRCLLYTRSIVGEASRYISKVADSVINTAEQEECQTRRMVSTGGRERQHRRMRFALMLQATVRSDTGARNTELQ
ncbi:hypothetical protein PR048_032125 [Dryococelus australis]|uniref:Uncharacterized protein n=1 Tax=Dryococelus australis TaxID=614101 RepID=A0ABQ9G2I6_9NEOP|nr:hypothetical protein PR048_032125 [Dryococelus australis]